MHSQFGLVQKLGDMVRLPPVEVERHRMAERLRQVQGLVADLEGEQQVAARGRHAVELGENLRQPFRWEMDDRVPGHDAAEGAVR